MPTARHVYVDPNATGSGVGTSWTNAYTTLNAAEQAEDNTGDLVTRDEFIVFHCRASSGGDDTATVSVSGWTTSATQYIEIHCGVNACRSGAGDECVSANRHGGVWDDTKYLLTAAIAIYEDYVRVQGLQGTLDSAAANLAFFYTENQTAGANAIWIGNCLVRFTNPNSSYSQVGILPNSTNTNLTTWNTIIYGSGTRATAGNSAIYGQNVNTLNVYGCTLISGYRGLHRVNGTVTAKNTYAHGGNSGYGGTLTTTNCASSDGSNGTTVVAHSTSTGAYFANITAGSEDYRITSASSGLINGGATLTDDPPGATALSTDIAGQTRA